MTDLVHKHENNWKMLKAEARAYSAQKDINTTTQNMKLLLAGVLVNKSDSLIAEFKAGLEALKFDD